jgi:hypothetical protein
MCKIFWCRAVWLVIRYIMGFATIFHIQKILYNKEMQENLMPSILLNFINALSPCVHRKSMYYEMMFCTLCGFGDTLMSISLLVSMLNHQNGWDARLIPFCFPQRGARFGIIILSPLDTPSWFAPCDMFADTSCEQFCHSCLK